MKWHKESDAPEEMSRGSAVRDMKWHKESDAPEEASDYNEAYFNNWK